MHRLFVALRPPRDVRALLIAAMGGVRAALHAKVDRALVRLGLDPERRAYLPHITLARLPRTGASEHEWVRSITR